MTPIRNRMPLSSLLCPARTVPGPELASFTERTGILTVKFPATPFPGAERGAAGGFPGRRGLYTGRHFTPWISVTMQFVSRLIEFATNHYLLVAALLVLLVLLLLHELRKGGKSLSTRELTALVNADQAVVLDIRPAKEFASGHIVDALNIPADKLNSRMTELEKYKGKTIILVDAMGQHSGTWGGVLKKAGFNAAKLSGGIGSWRGDNLPLVK